MTDNNQADDGAVSQQPSQQGSKQPRQPPSQQRPDGQVRVGSPDGVLAIVPHLLGFHPSRSLVVLGVGAARDRVALAFRYDLPDPPDAELATDIAAHACAVLSREAVPAAILIGYGPATLVTETVDQVVGALVHAGLDIREVLRAEGGRYWSALCSDPGCCPAEGVSYDPCSHPAAAVLNQAGLDAYPDRAALARTLEPEPGTARAVRQATGRALRRIDKLLTRAQRDGASPAGMLADAGRGAVQEAILQYRSGSEITDQGRLAFLAVALADLRVRDDAWSRMDPEHRRRHLRLWTDVVIGAAPEFVPAPASLLAFTAWQSGEGALANVAIERALAADPAYSMALLLAEAIQAGLPPSAARLAMPAAAEGAPPQRRPPPPRGRPAAWG
jgi:Domain of unknown function (DUF4192)